jgi:hypothetical protein
VRPLLPSRDSPLGVHVFRHDLQTGVRVKGRDAIQLVAPRGETRWREALLAIQSKLSKAGCRRLLELPYDDPRVAAAVAATPRPLTSAAFAYRPLAECTSAQRAKLLTSLCRRQSYVSEAATPRGRAWERRQAGLGWSAGRHPGLGLSPKPAALAPDAPAPARAQWRRRIDGQWLHPGTQLEDPPSAVVAGGRRQPKPAFEWQRGEIRDPDETSPAAPVRVACKSAQLLWDLTSKCGRPKPASSVLPHLPERAPSRSTPARTHARTPDVWDPSLAPATRGYGVVERGRYWKADPTPSAGTGRCSSRMSSFRSGTIATAPSTSYYSRSVSGAAF